MLPNENRNFTVLRYEGGDEERHEAWLDFRDKGVGGSDVAGILGLSNWSSPLAIWNQKTGRVPHEDLSGNEAVEWGTRLEPLVRDKFRERHPDMRVLHPDCSLVEVGRPWAHANLDGFVRDPDLGWGVLEIKTARSDHGWYDEDGNETVPVYYQTQAIHYMNVTGYGFARFAVLFSGHRYQERLFVPDDDDLLYVREAVDEFWRDFVERDVPPTLMTGLPDESRALYGMYASHDDGYEDLSGDREWERILFDYDAQSRAERSAKASKAELGDTIKARIGDGLGIRAGSLEVKWIRSEKRDSGLRIREV